MPQGWAALAQLRLIGGSGQGPPSTPLKPPPELAGIHWGLLGAQGLIQGLPQHAARLPRCSLFLGRVLGFCWAFFGVWFLLGSSALLESAWGGPAGLWLCFLLFGGGMGLLLVPLPSLGPAQGCSWLPSAP